jgi:hypothetical protein
MTTRQDLASDDDLRAGLEELHGIYMRGVAYGVHCQTHDPARLGPECYWCEWENTNNAEGG